jgi:UDP-N-acetylmuramoyl-tripeptide--D-alanyl-D-alanine ligase
MTAAFRIQDAVTWTDGVVLSGSADTRLSGVSIDSRKLSEGNLFAAIVGPNHDGHDYLERAAAGSAAALLVDRSRTLPESLPPSMAVIGVDDTTTALGRLAAGHRLEFHGPVVAVTGSNGKTTTKEMCASILGMAAPCHRTPGNFNNQYGLPLTLLGRRESDQSLVVELGMNHRGEIALLTSIAQPTVGLITNVGSAHIEYLGSREEIAREKGDLVALLPADATAVLNADDPLVAAQHERTSARVLLFGTAASAEVRSERVVPIDDRGYAIDLATPAGSITVEISGLGPTTIINALAAAAASLAAGASLSDIQTGLANYRPIQGRLERHVLPGEIVLVDDTYNANPQSTEAALRLLAELKGRHRAVAVLGDMGELGGSAESAHRETGKLAAALGIDFLITLGELAKVTADGALASGMNRKCIVVARDHAEASARAGEMLRERDTILVKGSRSMRMERIVEAIASEKRA